MKKGKNHLKCGLIGERLSHSFSPQIHRELSDYSYSLFELSESELGGFLKNGDFHGANVTIPYKKSVIPYLDEISDEAKRIGAVNTIVRTEKGGLRGDNTDYYGLWHTITESEIAIKGKKVLILGTGGASLTAKAVCEDMGAEKITFLSRSGEFNYENVYDKCGSTQIVINCTPVGMYPNNGASPVCLDRLPLCEGVIDIVYNPSKTQLLLDAERLEIKRAGGLSMLVAQAKRACEIFLDEKIDDGEIRRITDLISAKTENIILIGMPGCGKTTVGKILSNLTGRAVIDTDEMILSASGRSPSEIIKSDGEEKFREIEHGEVKNAGKMSGVIISTGGGVVTREENYAPLHQNGKIVFIHRSLNSLATADRPLSKNLEELYEKRLPLYRAFCDAEVSNDSTPVECAEKILEKLNLTRKDMKK